MKLVLDLMGIFDDKFERMEASVVVVVVKVYKGFH
jgi:hypothetical protein